MATSNSQIKNIIRECLQDNLGSCKINYSQLRFNCFLCDKGNKYNLEINTNPSSHRYLLMNCWSCHYSGHISRLLKDCSTKDIWNLIPELKSGSNYKFNPKIEEEKNSLILPENIPFYMKNEVRDYLIKERGLNENILIERKVCYIFSEDDNLFDNIVFPLYDEFGNDLKGFTTHNFTTKKYRNFGRMNFVPYLQFINPQYPITLTEGIYDSFSVPNAIPLLNTNINKAILEFCFDKNIILALDNEVEDDLINKHLHDLGMYGSKVIHLFKSDYKDLNQFNCDNKAELRTKYLDLFTKFLTKSA